MGDFIAPKDLSPVLIDGQWRPAEDAGGTWRRIDGQRPQADVKPAEPKAG